MYISIAIVVIIIVIAYWYWHSEKMVHTAYMNKKQPYTKQNISGEIYPENLMYSVHMGTMNNLPKWEISM